MRRPITASALEALGYAKAKDLIAYDVDATAPWPAATQRLIARVLAMPGVRIRPLDMRRYREEIGTIAAIFNDAWADNWGFVPVRRGRGRLSGQEHPAAGRLPTASPIGEIDGEPVGMTVTLPNLNEAIAGLDGRLLPFGWLKLLWRLKVRGRDAAARMPLMGIAKRLQGTPKGAALALGMIERIRRHYQRARATATASCPGCSRTTGEVQAVIAATGAPCPTSATGSTRRRWRDRADRSRRWCWPAAAAARATRSPATGRWRTSAWPPPAACRCWCGCVQRPGGSPTHRPDAGLARRRRRARPVAGAGGTAVRPGAGTLVSAASLSRSVADAFALAGPPLAGDHGRSCAAGPGHARAFPGARPSATGADVAVGAGRSGDDHGQLPAHASGPICAFVTAAIRAPTCSCCAPPAAGRAIAFWAPHRA